MFCPNCGKEVDEEQLFCRTCGGELTVFAESENEPIWLKRIGTFVLGASAFVVCCFALFFLLMKMGVRDVWAVWFLLAMSVLFAGVISALLSENRKLREKNEENRQRKSFKTSRQSVKLLEEREPAPVWTSIIEKTTENLVRNKRKTSDELK